PPPAPSLLSLHAALPISCAAPALFGPPMPLSEARLPTDPRPNDLEAYWMPFTPNRAFKKAPRLMTRAKGMYYYADDGRAVLDAADRKSTRLTPVTDQSRI